MGEFNLTDLTTYPPLAFFAFLAGLIDASAGGGGLIQLPALFLFFPNLPIPLILGTNKFSSIWGTSAATFKFYRSGYLNPKIVKIGAPIAFTLSFIGASFVSLFDPSLLRPLILLLLFLVILYTLLAKKLKYQNFSSKLSSNKKLIILVLFISLISFYDGFFGPGTGSFLLFSFTFFLGSTFLVANAHSKAMNLMTNLGAIALFAFHSNINYKLGFWMAIFNFIGGNLGAKIAIKWGSDYVRKVFIVVSISLLLKLSFDFLKQFFI